MDTANNVNYHSLGGLNMIPRSGVRLQDGVSCDWGGPVRQSIFIYFNSYNLYFVGDKIKEGKKIVLTRGWLKVDLWLEVDLGSRLARVMLQLFQMSSYKVNVLSIGLRFLIPVAVIQCNMLCPATTMQLLISCLKVLTGILFISLV